MRAIVWAWLAIGLMTKAFAPWSRDDSDEPAAAKPPAASTISPADAGKLKDIADSYQGSSSDITKLGMQIAQTFASEAGVQLATTQAPVLAIPFGAPKGDAAARKLADSAFAQVYGRLSISHHGHVGLSPLPLTAFDNGAAVARGHERQAKYVLYGAVDPQTHSLTVRLVSVKDGSVLWSESYPVTGADPAAIAAQVEAKMPTAEEN